VKNCGGSKSAPTTATPAADVAVKLRSIVMVCSRRALFPLRCAFADVVLDDGPIHAMIGVANFLIGRPESISLPTIRRAWQNVPRALGNSVS
jgi:hypothetical protein